MMDTPHPRARCQALNAKLQSCGIAYAVHPTRSAHEFQKRVVRKHHIPWRLMGQDHSFCGRRPHHYDDPSKMMWVPTDGDLSVQRMARMNVLCTSCFKNWMYLKHRNKFIGARTSW